MTQHHLTSMIIYSYQQRPIKIKLNMKLLWFLFTKAALTHQKLQLRSQSSSLSFASAKPVNAARKLLKTKMHIIRTSCSTIRLTYKITMKICFLITGTTKGSKLQWLFLDTTKKYIKDMDSLFISTQKIQLQALSIKPKIPLKCITKNQ